MQPPSMFEVCPRDQAILSLSPTVERCIGRAMSRIYAGVDRDDLYGPAWLGAIQAVDNHDPQRGGVEDYARWIVTGRIQDYLRTLDPLSREQRKSVREGYLDHLLNMGGLSREEAAEITRARVSAICSQVHASRSWYSAKEARCEASGPARPDGRSRMSTS